MTDFQPTWTYTQDMTLQLNRVRRLIPDVEMDEAGHLMLTDAEIGLWLTADDASRSQDFLVAANCCEMLADGMPDIIAENTAAKLSQTSAFWLNKAKLLRGGAARYALATTKPYAGGIERSDVLGNLTDSERIPQWSEVGPNDMGNRWPPRDPRLSCG